MFYWIDNFIKYLENSEKYFTDSFVELNFNRKLLESIKNQLLKVIDAYRLEDCDMVKNMKG